MASLSKAAALAAALRKANSAPYDLARVAQEKCEEPGVAGEPVVTIRGDFEGISVTCGKYLRLLAVDPERRRRGIGSALFADAVARGVKVVAAEAGNYFTPGVFADDAASIAFFRSRGCRETGSTQNLVTTQLPDEIPDGVIRADATNRDRVLDFIEREFGRIWRFEAARGRIFFIEQDGEIAGFSAHDANNRGLGFFGPTGTALVHRGRGLGTRLLHASLADLRRMGHREVVIPWTDAIDFYRKACGARVAHRFVIYSVP